MKYSMMFGALILVSGCGQTTGKRVLLETELTSDLSSDRRFTTGAGWEVELDAAMLSTGALYYFDGEPAFTSLPPRLDWKKELFQAISPISTAYAHPGHYIAGNAKGQVLAPYSADLLDGATKFPAGEGISGEYRSATFSFAAPTVGPAADMLDGHAAFARGRATKDGETIEFTAVAELADIERTAKDGEVTGCQFETADVESDGKVTITVHPRTWFNLVDFRESFEPDGVARIAFALGLAQLSAYHLQFTPTGP